MPASLKRAWLSDGYGFGMDRSMQLEPHSSAVELPRIPMWLRLRSKGWRPRALATNESWMGRAKLRLTPSLDTTGAQPARPCAGPSTPTISRASQTYDWARPRHRPTGWVGRVGGDDPPPSGGARKHGLDARAVGAGGGALLSRFHAEVTRLHAPSPAGACAITPAPETSARLPFP